MLLFFYRPHAFGSAPVVVVRIVRVINESFLFASMSAESFATPAITDVSLTSPDIADVSLESAAVIGESFTYPKVVDTSVVMS